MQTKGVKCSYHPCLGVGGRNGGIYVVFEKVNEPPSISLNLVMGITNPKTMKMIVQ